MTLRPTVPSKENEGLAQSIKRGQISFAQHILHDDFILPLPLATSWQKRSVRISLKAGINCVARKNLVNFKLLSHAKLSK